MFSSGVKGLKIIGVNGTSHRHFNSFDEEVANKKHKSVSWNLWHCWDVAVGLKLEGRKDWLAKHKNKFY